MISHPGFRANITTTICTLVSVTIATTGNQFHWKGPAFDGHQIHTALSFSVHIFLTVMDTAGPYDSNTARTQVLKYDERRGQMVYKL